MRIVGTRALVRVVGCLWTVALVSAACAPATSPPTQPTASSGGGAGAPTVASVPKTAGEQSKVGGRVIYGSFADAKVLNPVLVNDTASRDVSDRIYGPGGLVLVDPKTGEPKPYVAEKFDVSQDGKMLTFTLRDGVKWSDGSAFSGDDFKFTVQSVMRSKKTVRKSIFQDIVGAKDFGEGKAEDIPGIRVDGKTITVQLENVACQGIIQIGGFGIIPRAEFGRYLDPKDASKNLDDAPENTAPKLALGPFKLKEWTPNDHVTLTRNDNSFLGKPNLDEWVMKVYPDQTAIAAALKTGEVDLALAEPRDLEDLKRVDTLALYRYPNLGYTYIGWNQLRGGKEFFQSKAVRQALTYGLNVDLVIERVLFGEGQKMVAHTPPVSWAYDAQGLNEYKYDPQKAQQLLQQDGWSKGPDGVYQKGGQRLEFDIVTNSGNKVRETLLQVAVEQYKQIGISANAKTESFEALVDRTTKSKDPTYGDQGGHDFDAVILGWSLGADPDAYGIWHSSQAGTGNNSIGYKNPEVDKALADGRTRCPQADRKAAYKRMNQHLNEDQPYNFGFAETRLLFANKKIQGIEAGPYSRLAMWNVEKWQLK